ncbi:MAG: hypothetical protein IMZ61_08665 [Planctomycetes bacterium]|nr:hypothetical protein [Planctomycetota bacterium]
MFNSWDKNDPKDAQVILHMLQTGLTQTYYDLMNVKHYSRSRCLNQKCYRRIGALSRPIGVISAGKSGAFNPP